MKHKKFPQEKNRGNAVVAPATSVTSTAELNESRSDFSSSRDELARRAYFSYVNEGSLPGHDVQHWLEAEAALLADRDLTRAHGFEHQPN